MTETNCFAFYCSLRNLRVLCFPVRLTKLRNWKRKDWINTGFSVRKQPSLVLASTCSGVWGAGWRGEHVLFKGGTNRLLCQIKRMVKIHKGRCYLSLKRAIVDNKSSWGWKSLPICMALLTISVFHSLSHKVLIVFFQHPNGNGQY